METVFVAELELRRRLVYAGRTNASGEPGRLIGGRAVQDQIGKRHCAVIDLKLFGELGPLCTHERFAGWTSEEVAPVKVIFHSPQTPKVPGGELGGLSAHHTLSPPPP